MNYENLSFDDLLNRALLIGIDFDKFATLRSFDNSRADVLRIFLKDMDKIRALKQQLHDYAEYIEDLEQDVEILEIDKEISEQRESGVRQLNKGIENTVDFVVQKHNELVDDFEELQRKYNELQEENVKFMKIFKVQDKPDKPNGIEVNYYYKNK